MKSEGRDPLELERPQFDEGRKQMQGEVSVNLKDTHHFSKSFSEANSSHVQRTASTADDDFLPIFDA